MAMIKILDNEDSAHGNPNDNINNRVLTVERDLLINAKSGFQCIRLDGFLYPSTIYFSIVDDVEYVEMILGDALPDFFIKTSKNKFIITMGARFIDKIVKETDGYMIYFVRFYTSFKDICVNIAFMD